MTNKNIASNIRMMREHYNWTQQVLAEQAGVDVRTVQRAEAGEASAETLREIAGALRVTVEALNQEMGQVLGEFERMMKTHKLIRLELMDRGSELAQLLGACNALLFDPGKLENEGQEDAAAELNQYLRDYCDIWSDLEPLSRRDAEKTLQGVLDRLRALGLAVSAGLDKTAVKFEKLADRMPMSILCVCLSKVSAPRLVAWREKSGPVAFE